MNRTRLLTTLEGVEVVELRRQGRLVGGLPTLTVSRLAKDDRHLFPSDRRLLLKFRFDLRRDISLRRDLIVASRHIRVFAIRLQGRRVRRATTFFATTHGRREIN